MTFDEFCYELSKLRVKWVVDKRSTIRTDDGDCVITALYRYYTGKKIDLFYWQAAAMGLGLRLDEALLIMDACDNKKGHNQLFRIRLEGVTIRKPALGKIQASKGGQDVARAEKG